jgi:hypothetical protein
MSVRISANLSPLQSPRSAILLSIHLDALIWADDVSAQQRRVVDAVLAAARDGDFERLVTVLDPDMGLRADGGALAGASRFVRGAQAVAE